MILSRANKLLRGMLETCLGTNLFPQDYTRSSWIRGILSVVVQSGL